MANNKKRRKFVKTEIKRFPYCPMCGVKMIYFLTKGGNIPDNFATLEHIYSKNKKFKRHFLLPLKRGGTKKWRVLCKKCNNQSNRKEEQKIPKILLWFKSGKFPLRFKWLEFIRNLFI